MRSTADRWREALCCLPRYRNSKYGDLYLYIFGLSFHLFQQVKHSFVMDIVLYV